MPGSSGRADGDWFLAGRFCCLPTARSIEWDDLPARCPCRRLVNRTRVSPLGNARQPQAFQIVLPVLVPFERIDPAEVLDGEIRLETPQLLDVRLGFLAPVQMSERGDERFITGDE